jgi:hypothetical protein
VSHIEGLRELRTGWRALLYRGRHHSHGARGRLGSGVALFYAVYLR